MFLDWHKSAAARQLEIAPNAADIGINMAEVRRYRLNRVRSQMRDHDIAACILIDPVNIRYATGARNMQVFSMRNPARYLFLPVEGPVVLFEFTGCMHLAEDLETIDEVRPAITASFVASGNEIAERERLWARETASVIREHCGAGATIGIERVNAGATFALAAEGFRIVDAQQPVELARAVKSDEELKCVRASIRATEHAVHALRAAIEPGLSEQALWSVMYRDIIAQGGDYVETRLLSAGERTNPWFQEASPRIIQPNELIALDTDVVGLYGYYCDFSRTFHAGPDKPSEAQKTLYKTSLEQVQHNIGIIHPGMSFREYSEKAWEIPDKYVANRYYLSGHGVGMTGEYPYLYHRMDYPHAGYDGTVVPNMTLCVESYIGEEGGREGVKLEQHCLVTEDGIEVLSQFPFEDALMDCEDRGPPDVRLIASNPEPAAASVGLASGEQWKDAAVEHIGHGASKCASSVTDYVADTPSEIRDTNEAGAGMGATAVPSNLLDAIDLCLAGCGFSEATIRTLCESAVESGVSSIVVPPSAVSQARILLDSHGLVPRAIVGLPGAGSTTAAKAVDVREATRAGAGGIDIAIDLDAILRGEQDAALKDLRRVSDPARDAGLSVAVVIGRNDLDDRQLVIAARIAAQIRPDIVAGGSGLDGLGTSPRQIALIRAAVGPRPTIRAQLAPGVNETNTAQDLIQAGAGRLGILGAVVPVSEFGGRS